MHEYKSLLGGFKGQFFLASLKLNIEYSLNHSNIWPFIQMYSPKLFRSLCDAFLKVLESN